MKRKKKPTPTIKGVNPPYMWTVNIYVAPKWVADGFNLTEDKLNELLMKGYGWMTGDEVNGEIVRAPDKRQISTEQGTPVAGFKPLFED